MSQNFLFPLKEECIISFDGPGIKEHEMDVEVLANSLIAYKQLVDNTNSFLNKRETAISFKIKGGFKEGSLTVQAVLHYIGASMPLATNILDCVKNFMALKQFLKGNPPQEIQDLNEKMVQINNSDGSTMVFHHNVFMMNNSSQIKTSLGNFAKTLDEGINNIRILDNNHQSNDICLSLDDKLALTPPVEDQTEEIIRECELEILASQNDGRPQNWRFYDIEDCVEFQANVDDTQFLQDVKDKKYAFKNGDKIVAKLAIIKRFVNQRRHTDRNILNVLDFKSVV